MGNFFFDVVLSLNFYQTKKVIRAFISVNSKPHFNTFYAVLTPENVRKPLVF